MAENLMSRLAAIAIVVLAVSGCSSAVRWGEPQARTTTTRVPSKPAAVPTTHKVRAGESLYAIALRYALSAPDLARWNRLGSGELIFPGQVLRLRPDPRAAAPATPSTTDKRPVSKRPTSGKPTSPAASVRFVWPASGAVVSGFADPEGVGEGIDIGGKVGDPVRASGAGRVVYSGDGLKGYGNLIIVKHSERYLSAYGYNAKLLVKEGDQVSSGQSIAQMGRGPDRRAVLHFEIREHGKPVDPQRFLPRRENTKR
ncbi:MAG: peptidoglycan DD-metalloendopeptidase family protein [Gammaproteobacteria bacterium]